MPKKIYFIKSMFSPPWFNVVCHLLVSLERCVLHVLIFIDGVIWPIWWVGFLFGGTSSIPPPISVINYISVTIDYILFKRFVCQ